MTSNIFFSSALEYIYDLYFCFLGIYEVGITKAFLFRLFKYLANSLTTTILFSKEEHDSLFLGIAHSNAISLVRNDSLG